MSTSTRPREHASALFPAGIPRLNHVAMSVEADLLRGARAVRAARVLRGLLRLDELAEQGEEGKVAVMAVGHWDQFVFLHAETRAHVHRAAGPFRDVGRVQGRLRRLLGPGARRRRRPTTGST